MVWFLVDDNLTFHKKVTTAGNAAMGVWVRAGAWSTSSLTDGFIPTQTARAIGTVSQWDRLVNAGLMERVNGGYLFHDWLHKQPSKADIEERRERERQRKAEQRKQQNVPPGRPPDDRALPRARPRPTPPTSGGVGNKPHHGGDVAARAPTARCSQCIDNDGYRSNGTVCDHIDRTQTNANGLAACREAIGKKANRQ